MKKAVVHVKEGSIIYGVANAHTSVPYRKIAIVCLSGEVLRSVE